MTHESALADGSTKVKLCAAAVSLLLGRIGRWSGREIDASHTKRLGRSCLSSACFTLSLARSAQAERDNESCFFGSKNGRIAYADSSYSGMLQRRVDGRIILYLRLTFG
ncbi:hypothetical protein EVAR_89491_1 [Eumeta japonica]|uniref:Uncharacterized protein n=1 Tax=Eumeta variegata TaxID=151549 RepID=A0A4C1XL25_EUMVA|nr:hypothetical protein EVAR_89491_1 [Eumeta japonica]